MYARDLSLACLHTNSIHRALKIVLKSSARCDRMYLLALLATPLQNWLTARPGLQQASATLALYRAMATIPW